jgi:hypothetical protein
MLHDRPEPLAGAAAVVYDLLAGGEDFLGEEEPASRGG